MAKEADSLKFELGQWVTNEDGYGQIMYIRPIYVEQYETNRKDRKNGDFIRYMFICKLLCDFKGKVRNKINVYTSVSKLDKEGAEFIQEIKKNQPEEYLKYIIFDDKVDICDQIFLNYQVKNKESLDINEMKQKIAEINKKLYPAFTFKEFLKEFKTHDFPFDVEFFAPYGNFVKKEEQIKLRFDSYLYKVKGKEAIFSKVNLFDQ